MKKKATASLVDMLFIGNKDEVNTKICRKSTYTMICTVI